MTLQVVLPMGGLGQRFRDAGFDTPKPLIPVDGAPMFVKAVESLRPYAGELSVTAVVRAQDDDQFGLGDAIRAAVPGAQVLRLDYQTAGAVETVLAAGRVLSPELPLVVVDCDIAFESDQYFTLINSHNDLDGVLLSFASTDARYSYAEVADDGRVLRTAEKDPISRHALAGAYFFRTWSVFAAAGARVMELQIGADTKEFYLSLAFNEIIARGGKVGIASGDFYSFGTPEELARYEATGEPIGRA